MPAETIDPLKVYFQFTVLGFYARGTIAVQHVGLLASERQVSPRDPTPVYHSGPPLEIGQLDPDDGLPIDGSMGSPQYPLAVAGWPQHLNPISSRSIAVWLKDQRTLLPTWTREQFADEAKFHYIAHPHVEEVEDEVTRGLKYRKFSCAGFVERCYAEALGISLVDTNRLPPVDLPTLKSIWIFLRGSSREDLEEAGLRGGGPWPLLLPGYLFHSLARQELTTPFVPTIHHRVFPVPMPAPASNKDADVPSDPGELTELAPADPQQVPAGHASH